MKLLIDVRNDKVDFIIELLNEFDFVTILSIVNEEDKSIVDN